MDNSSLANFKDKVKNTTDLVNVVSEYIDLKKVGKNYKGLCPFHQEKTPSFTINPEQQFYHCFGCGVGGDVYDFLMDIENITFMESLKLLAGRVGLEIPNQSEKQKKFSGKRDKLFEINNLSAKFYHYLLMKEDIGKEAFSYLKNRGFTEEDMNKFYLGYAPDRWKTILKFLTKRGYKKDILLKAGLIRKKNNNFYDRFRGRIIFPIFNIREEVLAFGARIIKEQETQMPKYLNSPGTLIYNKGDNLYGINWAKSFIRKSENAVIMEGYTDVLTAHKAGINNAVASLGTALTNSQARTLKRFAKTVYIAYDADTAGEKATLRGLDILKNTGLKVKVITLPEGEDPDEYIKEFGVDKFKKLKEEALSLMDFKIRKIVGDKQFLDSEEKITLSRRLIGLLSNLDDAIEQDVYIQKVAQRLQLNPDLVRNEVKKFKKEDKNNKKRNNKSINKTNSSNSIIKLERKILKAFIDFPEYRSDIKNKINPVCFNNAYKNAAKRLWFNNGDSIHSLIEKIDDEKVSKLLMSLTVKEGSNVSLNTINEWISRLKENFIYKNKYKIYKTLQEQEKITLGSLNNLLINYKEISNFQEGGTFYE